MPRQGWHGNGYTYQIESNVILNQTNEKKNLHFNGKSKNRTNAKKVVIIAWQTDFLHRMARHLIIICKRKTNTNGVYGIYSVFYTICLTTLNCL